MYTQFLEFYPQGKITFSIFLLNHLFIFQEIKSLLENEKTKQIQNLIVGLELIQWPGPSLRARKPHPGRNLGLGQQSRAAARARLAGDGPINLGRSC